MKHRFFTYSVQILMLIILTLALSSCGKKNDSVPASSGSPTPDYFSPPAVSVPSDDAPVAESPSESSPVEETPEETPPETPVETPPDVTNDTGTANTTRTSTIYLSSADGLSVYGNELVTIDASHVSEGYIMASYTGSNHKVKMQLTGPNALTYTYNLHGGYETFPLTAGSGTYSINVYENIEGTSYATVFTQSISISITNEFGPYLYANQYVNFNASSTAVAKAAELAGSAQSDINVVQNVYNYMIENFTYDYNKAETVQSGYLPVVDDVFAAKTGICFDYAAIMATMLRTQNIPTRLEVGYMGDVYHAWISVYTVETGWINGVISFDGTKWEMMDPTFASTSSSPKDFLTKTDKYITKYVY